MIQKKSHILNPIFQSYLSDGIQLTNYVKNYAIVAKSVTSKEPHID